MNELLRDIYDLHIHTSPDVVTRKCDDLELARRLTDAGMKGCAIKCHYGDTAARAELLQKQFPNLTVVGGVTLNQAAGGVNPQAVERCAQMGGRMVWFPTLEAKAYQAYVHRAEPDYDVSPFLSLLDEEGQLIDDALKVLDIAARHQMVVGTGHVSAAEGLALVKAGCARGCRMVLTHADNPNDRYTLEEQQQAVALGATVEHCFFTTYHNRTPIEEIARQIRGVGCENVILTTDFGQLNSPYSDEGMAQYCRLLSEQGFTAEQLYQMTRLNQDALLSH